MNTLPTSRPTHLPRPAARPGIAPLTVALCFTVLAALPAWSATHFVTPTGAGNKDGSSWGNAFGTVQAAIDAAFTAGGDGIWVAKGTYTPGTTRAATFTLKSHPRTPPKVIQSTPRQPQSTPRPPKIRPISHPKPDCTCGVLFPKVATTPPLNQPPIYKTPCQVYK